MACAENVAKCPPAAATSDPRRTKDAIDFIVCNTVDTFASLETGSMACIYLIRHASPDRSRTDISYDVPPGPGLDAQGEREANLLGEFLRGARVGRMYASTFERAWRTATIAAAPLGLSVLAEPMIGEWRADERARDVAARVEPVLARAGDESVEAGIVCLVSHGGPIAVMLRKLGMPRVEVDGHRQRYGGLTPLPTAAVWRAVGDGGAAAWRFDLVFTPA